MAATKTVWWDKNNDQHEGWIKDGLTYMDEAATTRIPVGATVKTDGGTYLMTANGGVPTQATARNQYEANSNAAINAYKAAGNVQQERINSATNAAIAEINRQKQIAEQNRKDADRAAKEAYLAAANPFGALEEQRVRLGLDNSGYSESSKLKLASAYATQQTENRRAMNEQLSMLDVQIAQAKASGQYELANMLEARAQNVLQQQIALQSNLYSGDMQAMGQAESTRQFDEQMAWQKAQAEEQKRMNIASVLLEAGANSRYIADAFGISQSEADALVAKINAQRAVKVSGGGGGNSSKINTQYLQSLLPVIQSSGLTIEEWLGDNASAMGLDNDHRAALVAMYYAQYGQKKGNGNQGQNEAYKHAINVIGEMKRRGKGSPEAIRAYINSLPAGALSTSELDTLIDTYVLEEA